MLQMALFHKFLWLSSIPFVYMYHNFFIHSFVDCLGCLYVLAIVNSAAVKTITEDEEHRGAYIFLNNIFVWGYARSGIAGLYGGSSASVVGG